MNPCPPFESLSRQLLEPSEDLRQHLGSCTECGRAYSELRALHAAAPALPYRAPSAQEVLRSEDALIQATRRRAKGSSKLLPRAAALIAAGVVGFAVSEGLRPQTQDPKPATLTAQDSPPAPNTTTKVAVVDAPEKAAALPAVEQGELTFDLPKTPELKSQWHVLADAQVSGPGARLRATIVGGQLQKLEVLSGQVQLNINGVQTTVTDAASWPVRPQASAAELAFVAGQSAWDTGALVEAEAAFASALRHGATGALAEESRYWRVRALLKLDRPTEAKAVLQDILRKHPRGRRTASAHLDLALLAVGAGKTKEARRHLKRVLKAGTSAEVSEARAQLRRLD